MGICFGEFSENWVKIFADVGTQEGVLELVYEDLGGVPGDLRELCEGLGFYVLELKIGKELHWDYYRI